MELKHEFTVGRPLAEVWPVLIDLEAVADALPGASVEDAESDGTRHGKLRVKLGSFVAAFRGQARYSDIDEAQHQFTLEGSGSSPQGDALLSITGHATDAGSATTVSMLSSIDLTGRIAQFGSSMAPDVVSQMLDVFVANLTQRFDAPHEAEDTPAGASTSSSGSTGTAPGTSRGHSSDTSTLDLGTALMPGFTRHAAPVAIIALALAIGLAWGRLLRKSGPTVVVVPVLDLRGRRES